MSSACKHIALMGIMGLLMGFHLCFWQDIDGNQVVSSSKRFLQSTMELLQIATA